MTPSHTSGDSMELKPCPFCGHVGLGFAEGSTFRWLAFTCEGCCIGGETRVQTMGDGTPEQWAEQAKADAIEAWNTRSTPKQGEPGWQPIETAPKDSKARLVWCPVRKNCYLVSWDGRYEGEWTHFCSGGVSLSEEPTHWMPLPPAPKEPKP